MWDHAPGEGIQKLRNNKEEVEKVAKKLLKDKEETEGGKDVLSLLGPFIWIRLSLKSTNFP